MVGVVNYYQLLLMIEYYDVHYIPQNFRDYLKGYSFSRFDFGIMDIFDIRRNIDKWVYSK
jgi:hypothetical protein